MNNIIPLDAKFYKDSSIGCIGYISNINTIYGKAKWFNTIGGGWKVKWYQLRRASKKEIKNFKIKWERYYK